MAAEQHGARNRLPLKDWLPAERPRERLLRCGAGHLSLAELLAIVIGSGRDGEDAFAMAQRLLAHFGGLDALLQASPQVLLAQPGIGPARLALLHALHEVCLRYQETVLVEGCADQPMFADQQAVARYIQLQLGKAEQEVFACLYLDTRHRLLRFEEAFRGSVNRAVVFPREILRRCLALNASALILAHNHPSGVTEPSQADLRLTRELCDLLSHIDVRVLDHIIVARGATMSFASRGLMPRTAA